MPASKPVEPHSAGFRAPGEDMLKPTLQRCDSQSHSSYHSAGLRGETAGGKRRSTALLRRFSALASDWKPASKPAPYKPNISSFIQVEDLDLDNDDHTNNATATSRPKSPVPTPSKKVAGAPKVLPGPEEVGNANRPASNFFQGMSTSGHEAEVEANRKFTVGRRARISKVLESGMWQLFVFVSTLLALFLKDIMEACMLGEQGYIMVDWLYTSMLALFTLEIVLGSFCTKGYYNGFFFWLDVIGTASLVFDIRFFWAGTDAQGFIVARAGRAARSGTRTTRILRVLRVIRVLKVMRLPKMLLRRHRAGKTPEGEKDTTHKTSNLADMHAELVSRRVVVLVISMLLVLPATEYRTLEYTEQTPLDMINAMYEPVLHPFNSGLMNATVAAYLKTRNNLQLDIELTMLKVGRVVYLERVPVYLPNEKSPPLTDVPEAITMLVDTTWAKANEATLSIMMTSFIVVVFVVGSFVFSKDAQHLALGPMERITSVAQAMAGTLFAMDDATVLGMESAYVEAVMAKIARFFEVKAHKRTTIFTSSSDVWQIDVKREKETVARAKGSSHRITAADLMNCSSGDKKKLSQKLIFEDFLCDPQATRFFRAFLEREEKREAAQLQPGAIETMLSPSSSFRNLRSSSDKGSGTKAAAGHRTNCLDVAEHIKRFKTSMREANMHGGRLFDLFVWERSERALSGAFFQENDREKICSAVVANDFSLSMFDTMENAAMSSMRTTMFPAFVEHQLFERLMAVKAGQPRAIMLEQELEVKSIDNDRKKSGWTSMQKAVSSMGSMKKMKDSKGTETSDGNSASERTFVPLQAPPKRASAQATTTTTGHSPPPLSTVPKRSSAPPVGEELGSIQNL
jgi:hypothetical protein